VRTLDQPSLDALLDRVMASFWKDGLAASIDDVVTSSGATRHTLYKQFGGKHGVYAAVLERYSSTVVTAALQALKQGSTPRERIGSYFAFLISTAHRRKTLNWGCLMANTMAEAGASDAVLSTLTRKHFARLLDAFRHVFLDAGYRRPQADAAADFCATHAQGVWLRARSGASLASLRSSVHSLLSAIPSEAA
jgi:TetR/AcrR family transcriptional regulator, transcriptional repressor for nem operon